MKNIPNKPRLIFTHLKATLRGSHPGTSGLNKINLEHNTITTDGPVEGAEIPGQYWDGSEDAQGITILSNSIVDDDNLTDDSILFRHEASSDVYEVSEYRKLHVPSGNLGKLKHFLTHHGTA